MDKVWMLIGLGANSVMVGARVFKSEEDGLAFMANWGDLTLKRNACKHAYWNVDDAHPCHSTIYTSYYNGCGGVYSYLLKPVSFGEAFARFDLD